MPVFPKSANPWSRASLVHREFPENATEWIDPIGRRSFLELMSASLALAGVGAACTVQPDELIVPYVRQPEEEIPGRPYDPATGTYGFVAMGAVRLGGAVTVVALLGFVILSIRREGRARL